MENYRKRHLLYWHFRSYSTAWGPLEVTRPFAHVGHFETQTIAYHAWFLYLEASGGQGHFPASECGRRAEHSALKPATLCDWPRYTLRLSRAAPSLAGLSPTKTFLCLTVTQVSIRSRRTCGAFKPDHLSHSDSPIVGSNCHLSSRGAPRRPSPTQ